MGGTTCTTAEKYLASMRQLLGSINGSQIDAFADLLFDAWRHDRRVFVFGNGGSAFTASHHTMDLVKTGAVAGQKRLQCFSLVDNCGLTTALGNDVSYDDVFVYPLATYARAGDLAVAISCSGNSPNVLKACEWARANGLTVVCLSGFAGGKMAAYANLHINIPHDNYGLIEDLHLSIGHMVTQELQARVQAETEMGV
jgi:D-sedoheptulose 7-phosphate isomerase